MGVTPFLFFFFPPFSLPLPLLYCFLVLFLLYRLSRLVLFLALPKTKRVVGLRDSAFLCSASSTP